MSTRCLYCGEHVNGVARFCRGHHIPYRLNQIEAWNTNAEGSDEREEAARNLRKFAGWWDFDNNCPTEFEGVAINIRPVNRIPQQPIQYKFRKFGIELETASPSQECVDNSIAFLKATGVNIQNTGHNHTDVNYWKVLTDGSLSGGFCREIVSPAFDTEDGLAEVTKVANSLTSLGVKVNNSCGYHCHLDVSDLTPKQIARAVKFYQVYEDEIDKLHQKSRRGDNARWCHTLTGRTLDPERITSINDLRNVFHCDRYFKVNVEAYLRHGTLEFRQHGPTTDAIKILYWVKFCTRIVEYAKSDREIDSSIPLYEALNLGEDEVLYWNHRKEVLAA